MGPLTRSNKLRLQSQRTNARVERGFAPSDSEAAFPSSTPTGRTHSIRSPAPELLALGFQKGRSLAVPVASPPETSPGQGSQRQTLSGVWREGAWGPLCLIPPGSPGGGGSPGSFSQPLSRSGRQLLALFTHFYAWCVSGGEKG